MGSSPLARGPLTLDNASNTVSGLIPARAGTTPFLVCVFYWGVAHPRSRGDHLGCKVSGPFPLGSSPLARGPPTARRCSARPCGLIPARAGTTETKHSCWCRIWAHPRSRGDHSKALYLGLVRLGSSPLARGPHKTGQGRLTVAGLIPARAGTTWARLPGRAHYRAHPRSRGDHAGAAGTSTLPPGSSPLARGPRCAVVDSTGSLGLIPARAGTTSSRPLSPSRPRAHPRSRGDHTPLTLASCALKGSSPLARGPRDSIMHFSRSHGLIPARAGTTSPCLGPSS